MARSEEGQLKRKLKKKTHAKEKSKKTKKELYDAKEETKEVKLEKETLNSENKKIKEELTSVKEINEEFKLENEAIKAENQKMKSDLHSSQIQLEKMEKCDKSNYLSTVSKKRVLEKRACEKLKQVELTDQTLEITDQVIGEGTFGVVRIGKMTYLHIQCAVKSGNEKKTSSKSNTSKG
ncbi:uncharacterized protein [Clytia hemisphaerica]|uniref:uncharacterized protein n=1 Tax=Clytia hemisphaerica TaxID=252671 RepID=UPI0034D50138